jgi:precorrin-3B methylase
MNDIIAEKLLTIEREKNVTILYACESGSRAWALRRATAIMM